MTDTKQDLERLKAEYADRSVRLEGSDIYSPLNPSYLFAIQQRQRAIARLLQTSGIGSLTNKFILEIGCGRGDVLHELLVHRMDGGNLYGVELLPDRLTDAQMRFPGVHLAAADAQNLPYSAQQFDVVVQFTVFSSILDETIKTNIAAEMLRVVKPDGLILWYDFWLNPTNPQTKGIRKPEIQELFPNCRFIFKRITLAPPIARKLVPLSWTVSALLEKFLFLNTHFLVAIRPE